MIWGYPHFWKHPYLGSIITANKPGLSFTAQLKSCWDFLHIPSFSTVGDCELSWGFYTFHTSPFYFQLSHEKKKNLAFHQSSLFFFPGSLCHGLWNKPQLGSVSSPTKNTLNHQAFSSLFTSPTRWAPTYDRYKVVNYTARKTNMSPKKGLFQ